MAYRLYNTQSYFNYKKPSNNNFVNNNIYNAINHNDHSSNQNYIMKNNNEYNEQNRFTSKNPMRINSHKNQNLINNYNNRNYNDGNYSSNLYENDNNNYNNINPDLNQMNINSQYYNGYQYFEQKKHNELILKILIYIYYYEKDLSQKNIFINSIEKYYLINQNWFNQFKYFYSYNKLKEQLDSIKNHNYDIIDIYIKDIINKIIQTIKPNYQLLPQNLKINILSEKMELLFLKK